ncbi:MAG: sigma-70 family RNA polymerase sigma factor [Verrucomicrobiae bacterium]|nr:sigma-70 family RNA polymerase sigma factor [Verrucomicrobiae bacterium]
MSPRKFAPTRWTLIAAANGADEAEAKAALEELCSAYWYPLYAYVRSRGHEPQDAEDLVQGFFLRLVERDYFAAAKPERGKLRTFLLHQLNCHLADSARHQSAQKRCSDRPLLRFDASHAEAAYAAEPAINDTPEILYQRRWALTVVAQAIETLEAHYKENDRSQEFALLSPALTEPTATALDTTAVAAALTIPRAHVRVRVHRLRTRFRQVLTAQVASTLHTTSKIELAEELKALLDALRV